LLLLLFAAAIPVLLFGGWVGYLTAERSRAEARTAALTIASRVAQRVEAEVAIQLQVAETLAESPSLDTPDLGSFYEHAFRIKEARPLWETVELSDPSGLQVLNLLRPLNVPLGPTADRESFDAVLRSGRSAVGGIGPVGPISGKRLVTLRAPVIRNDELKYVLTVSFVPNAVSWILGEAGVPQDWIGAVVDGRGNIIARTLAENFEIGRPASKGLREAIARAPSGFYVAHTIEGIEVETVYRTLRNTGGWSVHLGVPREALNGPVERSLFILAGGGAASLALAGVLAFLTARDIAQRRRQAEERAALALKVSEDRAAVAVEAADLGSWGWDVARDEVVGSERFAALLGLAPAAGDAQPHWSFDDLLKAVLSEDRGRVRGAVEDCLAARRPLDVEFRVTRLDGPPRWVRLTGRAPGAEDDGADVVHGVIADIEPRKRAEAERQELLRRLAEAQEDEQRRIARELHDQVGQAVTGLSLGLKRLENMLSASGAGPGAEDQVKWLQAITAEIGRDIHRAAADLRPTALDDLGLVRALEAYASDWQERFGIVVDVQVIGLESRLAPEIETAVYRIVQEALTNVLKHARASNVSVLLERRSGRLRLIVEDDGCGFDPAAEGGAAERPRLGLSGIRERLALIEGTMTIESIPDGGAALFIQIPIPTVQRAEGGR
jgi:signal transduction histidine kinase